MFLTGLATFELEFRKHIYPSRTRMPRGGLVHVYRVITKITLQLEDSVGKKNIVYKGEIAACRKIYVITIIYCIYFITAQTLSRH